MIGRKIQETQSGPLLKTNNGSALVADEVASVGHVGNCEPCYEICLRCISMTSCAFWLVASVLVLALSPPAAGAGPVAGHTPPRQPLYWWRLDTLTEGAAHETSAGPAAGGGDGRVWGADKGLAAESTDSRLAVGRLRFVALLGNLY